MLELRKAPKGGKLHPLDERANRIVASPLSPGPMALQWQLRAKVEHPFRVIKRPFGHVKTRYRGLATNRAQLFNVRARQPVPGAPQADDRRTSLPGNHATAAIAARNP